MISIIGPFCETSGLSPSKERMYSNAGQPQRPEKPWEFGVSEELQIDRFLRRRQLPDILHPIEGGSMATASRFKQSADGMTLRYVPAPRR